MTKRAVMHGCRQIAPFLVAAVVGASAVLSVEWVMLKRAL